MENSLVTVDRRPTLLLFWFEGILLYIYTGLEKVVDEPSFPQSRTRTDFFLVVAVADIKTPPTWFGITTIIIMSFSAQKPQTVFLRPFLDKILPG